AGERTRLSNTQLKIIRSMVLRRAVEARLSTGPAVDNLAHTWALNCGYPITAQFAVAWPARCPAYRASTEGLPGRPPRRHYQTGQENQLDSLGIMINIIVL